MGVRLFILALALAASGNSVAFADNRPKPIPIETFAALPALTDPVLSADGHKIATLAKVDGKVRIVVLDADRPGVIQRTITLGDTQVSQMHWAGGDRLLVTVLAAEKIAGNYDFPFLRLIAVDVPTGQSRVVDPDSRGIYAGDVLYTDPSGSWALVASQNDLYSYPSVKRVDLITGKARQVEKARDRVWDWYADERGTVRAGIAYEGRRWTLWYRDNPDEKLRRLQGKISKQDEDSAVDRFIFRGGQSWIVTNEKTGRFGLYYYDLTKGVLGEAIFDHPEVDLDDVAYDPSTGKILAVQYEDDRRHRMWFDADFKTLQAKLDKALPSSVNLPSQMSTDKSRILVWSQGASDPGRYFLLDRKAGKMHAIVDPYPAIDPSDLANVQWVRYRARDGLDLHGYLTLPKGREAKNLPLIMLPHGGPFERDHWEYDPLVQLLANRGYAVFQPQFRGSTGYGRDFVAKGYGQWGTKMQDDLDDGVAWLASSGKVDPKRVCIVGSSYGGYAAMWAAIRNPNVYRCAASFAGVMDLPRQLSFDKKLFSATRYYKEWRDKVDGEGARNLGEVSPINFPRRVAIPVFIAHGEKDPNVPVSQSRAMVEALTEAKANVTSAYYPDAVHGFTKAEDQADWFHRLEAFLTRYNPA